MIMPKWKKDETEFNVSVTYHEHRGCQAYLPKPIIEMLGNPKSIKFIVKDNKKIELKTGDL
jgi:hypothetical protein